MKITQGKYKQEPDVVKYIEFFAKANQAISLVFIQRLAAWVRDTHPGKKLVIQSAFRTYEQQVASKLKYPDLAANPGTSWHEFHLAVDIASESNYMVAADYEKSYRYQSLYKYGLYIPMNKIDSPSMLELWHITPIECKGIASALRKTFLDEDDIIYGEEEDMATIIELQAQVKKLTTDCGTLRTALDAERRVTKALQADKYDLNSQLIDCHQQNMILKTENANLNVKLHNLQVESNGQINEIVRLTGLVNEDAKQDAETKTIIQRLTSLFKL